MKLMMWSEKKLELDRRIENGTEMLYVWAGKYYIIPTQFRENYQE